MFWSCAEFSKIILPTDLSLNYYSCHFSPPSYQIQATLQSFQTYAHTEGKHNSFVILWGLEPVSFGLSERLLCIWWKHNPFFCTLNNLPYCLWHLMPMHSAPQCSRKTKQSEHFSFYNHKNINVDVQYQLYLCAFTWLWTLRDDHLVLFSIKTVIKMQSQFLSTTLNVCHTVTLHYLQNPQQF